MSNFVIKGPTGQMPSIKYIEDLIEVGILTPNIGLSQIERIKQYNIQKNKQIQRKNEIIKAIIMENNKLKQTKNQQNQPQKNTQTNTQNKNYQQNFNISR